MNENNFNDRVRALAPRPVQLETRWAAATLTRIVGEKAPVTSRRSMRHRVAIAAAVGVMAATSGSAVAATTGFDALDGVKGYFSSFGSGKNSANGVGGSGTTIAVGGLGTIGDPQLVTEIERHDGSVYAVWMAVTSTGEICMAETGFRSSWNGAGEPSAADLDGGCAAMIAAGDRQAVKLERSDQIGAFFTEAGDTFLYGVAPYTRAVKVRVQAAGVDRTIPLRDDTHGYGAALPEAAGVDELTLTFLDATGASLGDKVVPRNG